MERPWTGRWPASCLQWWITLSPEGLSPDPVSSASRSASASSPISSRGASGGRHRIVAHASGAATGLVPSSAATSNVCLLASTSASTPVASRAGMTLARRDWSHPLGRRDCCGRASRRFRGRAAHRPRHHTMRGPRPCARPNLVDLGYHLASRLRALYAMKPQAARSLRTRPRRGPGPIPSRPGRPTGGHLRLGFRGTFEGLPLARPRREPAQRADDTDVSSPEPPRSREIPHLDAGHRAGPPGPVDPRLGLEDSYVSGRPPATLAGRRGHAGTSRCRSGRSAHPASPTGHPTERALARFHRGPHSLWSHRLGGAGNSRAAAIATLALSVRGARARGTASRLADITPSACHGSRPVLARPDQRRCPGRFASATWLQNAREVLGRRRTDAGDRPPLVCPIVFHRRSVSRHATGSIAHPSLGDALPCHGGKAQARIQFVCRSRKSCVRLPMPLRVADALDGHLAACLTSRRVGLQRAPEQFASAAASSQPHARHYTSPWRASTRRDCRARLAAGTCGSDGRR